MTFEYSAEELGLDKKISPKFLDIRRLRPLDNDQPWGIFFIAFDETKLPVVALRRLLSKLALSKRSTSNANERASWHANDLLLISQTGKNDGRSISFAHFTSNPKKKDLPILKVLGWDSDDTGLKIDHVIKTLREKLIWPEDPSDSDAWREQWRNAFTLKNREVIQSSKEMAQRLGQLALAIRNRLREVLAIEAEEGPLNKLMLIFKETLISDLDNESFSDMYAQTIAYGLLSARIINPKANTLDKTYTQIPITNPFLRDLMDTFLNIGGRKKNNSIGLDFDELGINDVIDLLDNTNMEAVLRDFMNRNQEEDPVMHFFEGFLEEYDNNIRKERGVFYTPQPVVSFIVSSVDELMRTEFDLENGLADTSTWGEMSSRIFNLNIPDGIKPNEPFVQILDPATGTGTFIVEVIDVIYKTMVAKWQIEGHDNKKIEDLWNDYVPKHLLTRLHGYELMMAPYAIAHMKIGLKLLETGYRFDKDVRARIYLTNALEPEQDFSGTFAFAIPSLAQEAEEVNEIKKRLRFTVVIGNPPYSIVSSNMSDSAKSLIEQYRYIGNDRITERGALGFERILQDDYIKFIGLSQTIIRNAGVGIVGMITNGNFFLNPVLRGLRYSILSQFKILHLLDLGGQSKAGFDKDEPIFDITTGVAITLLVQHEQAKEQRSIKSIIGSRQLKYDELLQGSSTSLCQTSFNPIPDHFLFKYFDEDIQAEYNAGFPIDKAFKVTSIGIKTGRDHLVLDSDKTKLEERITALRDENLTANELQERFVISDNTQWKFEDALPKFRKTYDENNLSVVNARPFDKKWLCYDKNLVHSMRPNVNKHVYKKDNITFLTNRRIRTNQYAHFFVLSGIGMGEIISSADNCNFFPLYLYSHKTDIFNLEDEPISNLTPEIINAVYDRIGKAVASPPEPMDIFNYAYGVFHSRIFRKRYSEFLKTNNFPRLPITHNANLFSKLSDFGDQLVNIHLLKSKELDKQITNCIGSGNFEVEKVSYSDETVWINRARTQGFQGVSEEVWRFQIGNYQVCEKWLKDRQAKSGKNPHPGLVLTDEDVSHYQKIVVALSETIDIMAEIDEVIEKHGGWPDAFKS